MKVRRYVGEDITDCMTQVRDEMGPNALIINQRTIKRPGLRGLFSKPRIEVVAADDNEAIEEPKVIPRAQYTLRQEEEKPPEPDREETTRAAMNVLERIAQAQEPPAMVFPTNQIPQAPAAISAYSPHSLRKPVPVDPEPAEPPKEDGFTPVTIRRVQATAERFPTTPVAPAPAVLSVETTQSPVRDMSSLAHLETKLDAVTTTLNQLVSKIQLDKSAGSSTYSPQLQSLVMSLIEQDVHEEFAHKLAREAQEILRKQEADPKDVMEQLVRQSLGEAVPIKLKKFKRSVVMLVGPTGVGKTTTLAKLAAIYRLNHHCKVGLITTDTFRIAAVEQLKIYAEILEIPLSIVYAPEDITDALREHEDKEIVLIDTAGRSPTDSSLEGEVTALIRNSDCDEVHLVLSSTTSFSGLLRILHTYSFLRDFRIIITKLDETPSWGMVLNTKFLTDKPISYLANGQRVPDDIEVMNSRGVTQKLLES
jgi:flagellar biosynthesis protein FlhF